MFRSKPIDITFYTPNQSACDLFPPTSIAKKRPSWFGAVDSDGFDLTVQNCRGMREFFRHGIAVPLWSDLKIQTTDDQISWEFSDRTSQLQVETNFGVMQRPGEALCKLIVPWAAECSDPVPFMQVQNMWEPNASAFRSINGTMEFKYQHAINLFLYVPSGVNVVVEAGTTFFILAPLSERPIRLSVKHDPDKYAALRNPGEHRSFFKNWYVKQRHVKEKQQ